MSYYKKQKIKLSEKYDDGRFNSFANETEVLEAIEPFFNPENAIVSKYKLKLIRPKFRAWFDFAIEGEVAGKDPYIPINIKVSNLEIPAADNLNCKTGIFF